MQKRISRGLTIRQKQCSVNLSNKLNLISVENANINNIRSLHINTNNIKTDTAHIGRIKIGHDTDLDTGFLRVPNNFSISTEDGDLFIANNGDITLQRVNISDSVTASDGKFVGNIEATHLNLLGDIVSTNSHVTNHLNVDGDINGTHVRATRLSTNNMDADTGAFNDLTTRGILVNGITETPQISSKIDLALSVGPNCTINVPNIRYNVNLANLRIIGPAELKLSKIFIANGDVRLVADVACDGLEVIIYNNTVANIKITGPQFITIIPQKSIKKFLYLAILQTWVKQ